MSAASQEAAAPSEEDGHEFVADPYRPSQCVNCGRHSDARIHDTPFASPAVAPVAVSVKGLDDDQIMEIIKEVAPWKDEPQFNDLLTYEKSPPLFPQATYDVPSYRATKFVRAVEARILSSIIPATKGGEDVVEALKAYQGLASAVMTALMGNETRDDLLLADKVHQAHGKARVALAALSAQDTDGVAK